MGVFGEFICRMIDLSVDARVAEVELCAICLSCE